MYKCKKPLWYPRKEITNKPFADGYCANCAIVFEVKSIERGIADKDGNLPRSICLNV